MVHIKKIFSSSRDSDDLSIGFHRSIQARERDLTNKKQTKGNYHVEFLIKDIFEFADDQLNCAYGLGYNITIERKKANHVPSHIERTYFTY